MVIAGVLAVAAASARADDPPADPRAAFGLTPAKPAPAKPTRPEDLFGLDRGPRKPPPGCAEATALSCPRRDGDAPAAVETHVTRAYLRRLPTPYADLGGVAGVALGATRDDAGLAWGGASSLDNRWLLDGAPIDSARYGELGTSVPIAFLSGVRIRTAGFGARDRAALGATIDASLREGGDHHAAEGWAWLGAGGTPSTAPRPRGEYQPFAARYADYRAVSASAVADGPLATVAGARLWYVAGVAPVVWDQGLERKVYRLADADGDGEPDRAAGALVHERLVDQHLDGTAHAVPVLVRTGLRRGAHDVALTALGNLGRTLRWRGVGDVPALGVDQERRDLDLIATGRGRWGATALRVQGSWHRAARRETPHHAQGGGVAIAATNVPPTTDDIVDPRDAVVRRGCADDAALGDPYPDLENCPILAGFYWIHGVGALTDVVEDRPTVSIDIEHRAGEHLLAAGVTGEDARVVVTDRWSGGLVTQAFGSFALIDRRYVALGEGPDTCAGEPCTFLDAARTTYRTRHAAAYVADTWRPDPTVAVEYGVRAEQSQAGTELVLRDVLPRAGASWDFLGRGRSRVFLGWGRYAQIVPAGVAERITPTPRSLQTVTVSSGDTSETVEGGTSLRVRPGSNGTRVDEALAGVEVGLPDVVRLGVTARYRHLGRALEDDDGELTTAGVRGGVPATRDFTEVAVMLDGSPAARLGVRLGYAWSRLRGNWPGPYDPVDGYNLYTSSLFDDDASTAVNATGALPNDQPHRFFAELALRGRWRGFAVDGSVRAAAASGRPRDARIGFGQEFAIPRGAAGRLPAITTANLHLGARRGRLTATLDVYNLFDRRGVTAIDDRYASDARPVSGGDLGDLIWLKDGSTEDAPAGTNPGYGLPTRYQTPIAVFLGVGATL